MYYYLLILRILHITGGVMWAGAAFFMAFYLFPAVIRSGPDGGKMMQAISNTNKFPVVIAIVSSITVLTGVLLVWHLSYKFTPAWFGTRYGLSLTIGGVTAIIAYLQALFINRPGITRIQEIGSAAAARGGAPNELERTELGKLRDKIYFSTRLIAFWLFITVITMASARYL
jgi:uncharacterized membrane protein